MATPAYPGDNPGQYDPSRLVYPPEHMPPEHQASQMRPRRTRPGWLLGCGIVLGVLLVPCVLISILVGILFGYLGLALIGTGSVLGTFCGDLKTQSYPAAYDTFSSGLRAQISRDQFVAIAHERDQSDGPVRTCDTPNNSISVVNNTATRPISITRRQTVQGTIGLVKEGNSWKINELDPALQLTG
jgi:hypothetical protein